MFTAVPFTDLSSDQKQRFQIGVVSARWHADIVEKLLHGVRQASLERGISESQLHYYSVSGTYEIPQMIQRLASTGKFHGLVPLGCVIRGETGHYDLIVETVASTLQQIAISNRVAVSFGILTVENLEQAIARAGGKKGNKGSEALHAALDLAVEMEKVR